MGVQAETLLQLQERSWKKTINTALEKHWHALRPFNCSAAGTENTAYCFLSTADWLHKLIMIIQNTQKQHVSILAVMSKDTKNTHF